MLKHARYLDLITITSSRSYDERINEIWMNRKVLLPSPICLQTRMNMSNILPWRQRCTATAPSTTVLLLIRVLNMEAIGILARILPRILVVVDVPNHLLPIIERKKKGCTIKYKINNTKRATTTTDKDYVQLCSTDATNLLQGSYDREK